LEAAFFLPFTSVLRTVTHRKTDVIRRKAELHADQARLQAEGEQKAMKLDRLRADGARFTKKPSEILVLRFPW
jgi:hypothetical protein